MAIETTARGVVARVASPARALVLVAGVALVAEGAQLWIKHLLLFVSTHLPAQAFTNDAHELPFGLPKAIAQVAPQAAEVRAGVFVGVCGRVPRQVDGLKQPLANQVTVDTESGLSSVGRHDIDLLAHPQRGVSWHTVLNMHVITFGVKVVPTKTNGAKRRQKVDKSGGKK